MEWRLIRAGTVKLGWQPARPGHPSQADLDLQASGLVAKLYKVDDRYTVHSDEQFCVSDIFFKAFEGKRQRETRVTFDRARGQAVYQEKDLLKNATLNREVDTPACVQDVVNSLYRLRGTRLEPRQSTQFPISDGRKMVWAKVEAQEREQVKTPAGTFSTIRYEGFLFNDVLYSKQASLLVWISDDARRLPVQLRVRLQPRFLIGTITFALEKVQ